MSENQNKSKALAPAPLDWAALLARWMDFARAAVALPENADGSRWRATVSPIITLQAVTLALGELHLLDAADWSVAVDRASLLVDRETDLLEAAWGGDLPLEVQRLIADASAAVDAAQGSEQR